MTTDPHPPALADARKLRTPPVTARGVRTRAALVAAARRVFERDGFVDARLTDITLEAGCSTGTFYTYFDGKDEIFHAVLLEVQDEMLHPGASRLADASSPRAVIEAGNRAYLRTYRKNAKLMLLLEQVAAVDPEFRAARHRRSKAFVVRNTKAIRELQAAGLADPSLDPALTARALSSMVSRVAFDTFCLGERATLDALVETTTTIWVNALKLRN
ncbi:TetR/AcrR family transcriptional regulator [Calidifontibacter terrae]